MYLVVVILLLLVSPLASVIVQAETGRHDLSAVFLVGRWWVFWAVGVRLLVAGVRQVMQPAFTAQEIFGIEDQAALPIVREVGFGNLAMGTLGVWSLFQPAWVIPAAIVGGLYYGLAGVGHVGGRNKNAKEWTALVSDLFVFGVLLFFVVKSV